MIDSSIMIDWMMAFLLLLFIYLALLKHNNGWTKVLYI